LPVLYLTPSPKGRTMNDAQLTRLAKSAADTVAVAAIDYVWALDPNHAFDVEVLKPILCEATKASIDEALDNAKEALEANLGGWATEAFKGPLVIAGIEAAKSYLEKKEG